MKKKLFGIAAAVALTATAAGVYAVSEGPARAYGSMPSDLSASVVEKGVRLQWHGELDVYNTDRIVESFELYQPGDSVFGAWTSYDLDETPLDAKKINLTVGKNLPAAWYVTGSSEGSSLYRIPTDGVQQVAVSGTTGSTDDWLVSPLVADVPGNYVRFTMRLPYSHSGAVDKLELMVSSTDRQVASFTCHKVIYDTDDAESITPYYGSALIRCNLVTEELPAGTKYFALRYTSTNGCGLLIDALSYIPAQRAVVDGDGSIIAQPDLTAEKPQGFNIYRDGVKINDEPCPTDVYYDNTAGVGSYVYQVSAVYAGGESRKSAACNVTVSESDVQTPVPSGLTGKIQPDGMALTWTAPLTTTANTEPFVESFEDESYAITPVNGRTATLGPWTLYSNAAKQVESSTAFQQIYGWYLLSGNARTGSYQIAASTQQPPNSEPDAWLISPKLNGAAQTLQFYTRCSGSAYNEVCKVQVMATSGNDPLYLNGYEAKGEEVHPVYIAGYVFQEWNVELPEGTTYFALRNISEDLGNFLRIDDITFIPAELPSSGASTPSGVSRPHRVITAITGYNIYRDGVKINDTPVAELAYLDRQAPAATTASYTVRAVYAGGIESADSEPFVVAIPEDPAAFELEAKMEADGVRLNWQRPELTLANANYYTEDFAGFKTDSIQETGRTDVNGKDIYTMGQWTLVERGDGGIRASSSQTTPMYIYSGCIRGYAYTTGPANDWLISERLSGRTQYLSFNVYSGTETASTFGKYRVFYTMSDDPLDYDSYIMAKQGIPSTSPTTINVRLPYGATYFAMVICSKSTTATSFDDICYQPAREIEAAPASAPARVIADFLGYNIYRGEEKINSELLTTETFLDTNVEVNATYSYTVKAVYGTSESAPSNEVVITVPSDPVPTDLTAAMTPAGVVLNWKKPQMTYAHDNYVTEDFSSAIYMGTVHDIQEDYNHPGVFNLGPWQLVERGSGTRSSSTHLDGYPFYLSSSTLRAYSYSSGDEPTNDWIISEPLSGRCQTVSFDIYSSKTATSADHSGYKCYYTLSDDALAYDSYELALEGIPTTTEKTISFEVPFGAKHFAVAICNPGSSGYTFFSQFTYQPEREVPVTEPSEAPARVIGQFAGYNVYRDGAKINTEPVTDETFTDADVAALTTYKYKVTALYAASETAPTDEVEVTVPDDPVPFGIKARMSEGGVKVEWNRPDMTYANSNTVTEDFSDYGSTSSSIKEREDLPGVWALGTWSMVERGSGTRNTTSHYGRPFYLNSSSLRSYGYTESDAQCDDWLISEELSGRTQDLTFLVYSGGSESGTNSVSYAVYYTMADDMFDYDSYVKAHEDVADNTDHTITVRLPFGSKHFAIVNTNLHTSYLLLDDITYQPAREVEAAPASAPARAISNFQGYNLYRNDVKVNSELLTDESYVDADVEEGESYSYAVSAVYGGRETARTDEAVVIIPGYPLPYNVFATQTPQGVSLVWNAPEGYITNTERFTEDFDRDDIGFFKCTPTEKIWTLSYWTVIERNSGTRQAGSYQTRAFTLTGSNVTGYGNCLYTSNYKGEGDPDIDDWLISEELSGAYQTIDFEYWSSTGTEARFDVLYTLTDDILNPDAWVKVGGVWGTPKDPTPMSFDVPSGARHFALHATSPGTSYLRLDNFSYIPARVVTVDAAEGEGEGDTPQAAPRRAIRPIDGYNIYRDGVKLNDTPVTELTFVDTTAPGGDAAYTVTAVHGDKETAASAPATLTVKALPAPAGVGSKLGQQGITLAWASEAFDVRNTEAYTEDFDSYYAGQSTNITGWTLLNTTGSDVTGRTPAAGAPATVYAGFYISKDAKDYETTGKALMGCNAVNGTTDNWAITPMLSGAAQSVTFAAWNGYSTGKLNYPLEVLVSSTDTDPASFQTLENLTLTTTKQYWTVSVPEGTCYLAFRNQGSDSESTYVMIDNVTYIPALRPGTPAGTPVVDPTTAPMMADGFNLYCNGEKLNTSPITGLTYVHNPGGAGDYAYTVEAIFGEACSMLSEAANVAITPDMINLPVPTTLAATKAEEDADMYIELSWGAPVANNSAIYTTESFESYRHGATTMAPWTLWHGDEGTHADPQGDAAWYVSSAARTGVRGIRCDKSSATDGNNDWIISPELPGVAQTISFWVKCQDWVSGEKFDIQVSTTDDQIESFSLLEGSVRNTMASDWKQYTYDLPEATRYFAIRCISIGKFGLMLDDITYASSMTLCGDLIGYNVYRSFSAPAESMLYSASTEGYTKLNSLPLTSASYRDSTTLTGHYSYLVTAVYPWGESDPTEAAELDIEPTGIENVSADSADGVRYFTIQGVEVTRPAAGQVYLEVGTDGSARKVLIK